MQLVWTIIINIAIIVSLAGVLNYPIAVAIDLKMLHSAA